MSARRIEELITRIERAPDFGYDDETVELNALLARTGRAWKWHRDSGRVVIYTEG